MEEGKQMSISVPAELETQLRHRAEAEGLAVEAYVERLIRAVLAAEDELGSLALEGLSSGDPLEGTPSFWQERHRRHDERLKHSNHS